MIIIAIIATAAACLGGVFIGAYIARPPTKKVVEPIQEGATMIDKLPEQYSNLFAYDGKPQPELRRETDEG